MLIRFQYRLTLPGGHVISTRTRADARWIIKCGRVRRGYVILEPYLLKRKVARMVLAKFWGPSGRSWRGEPVLKRSLWLPEGTARELGWHWCLQDTRNQSDFVKGNWPGVLRRPHSFDNLPF